MFNIIFTKTTFRFVKIIVQIMFLTFKNELVSRGYITMKKSSNFSNMLESNLLRILVRENTNFKHNYSPEVEAAINGQIQVEQQAAQEYLSMAAAFLHPSLSRAGTGGYFMRMYHEEIQHAEAFMHYQLNRGGMPLISGLKAPISAPKITMKEAFKKALDLEHSVTKLLENLLNVAECAKDHHCVNFVTSVFIEEQMDAIQKLNHHVSEVERISNNEEGLWHYDLHLALRYPYKFKPMKDLVGH